MAKQRRKFTEKELNQIEGWSAIRLPLEEIAILLKVDKDWFLQLAKKDSAVHTALDDGRAKSKGSIRQTLYQMAMGRAGGTTQDGKVVAPQAPDFKALRFWCQTQEGFKINYGIEHTAAGEKDPNAMSEAEVDAEIAKLSGRIAGLKSVPPKQD